MTDTTNTNDGNTTGTNTSAQAPTLDQVYDQYETAYVDFETKLSALNDATAAVKASAQSINTIKQQLDTLEAEVNTNFEQVKPFLAA